MRTIYGLFWVTHEHEGRAGTTTWLDDKVEAEYNYEVLVADGLKPLLFSFEVEDDTTEDEVTDIMGDFMVHRVHLADLVNARVLQ